MTPLHGDEVPTFATACALVSHQRDTAEFLGCDQLPALVTSDPVSSVPPNAVAGGARTFSKVEILRRING